MRSMETTKIIKEIRGDRTQKEFAKDLKIPIRTVQNWEYRGTNETTCNLLIKIKEQAEEIEKLNQIIKDKNMVFLLPKE